MAIALAYLLLTLSLANLLPQRYWFQEININLGGYYLVCHALISSLLAIRIVRSWSGQAVRLLILNLALALYYLAPLVPFYLPSGQADPLPGAPRLELLYANFGRKAPDCRALHELLRRSSPDLVMLARPRGACAPEATDGGRLDQALASPSGDGTELTILSRYALAASDLADIGEGAEGAILEAQLMIEPGRAITLTLFDSPPPFSDQASFSGLVVSRRLAARYRHFPGDLIMAGDMWATHYSPHYAKLVRIAGLEDAMHGFGVLRSWAPGSLLERFTLDHLLYKGRLRAVSFAVEEDLGGERLPYLAEIALQ